MQKIKLVNPPSQKTSDVSLGMKAKQFLLRSNVAKGYADGARDFAPDEAQGEDILGVIPRELHLSMFIITALFTLGFFISVFLVRNRLDTQVYGTKFELLLSKYESDITVSNNNINIFILTLKNPNIENKESISFQLFEGEQVIRELQFSGGNVGDPSDVRLQFDPITDSAGKNYKVKLDTTESSNPVSVYVGDDREVAYRAYFRSTNKTLALKNFTSSFFSRLFADKLFLGILLSLVLLKILLYKRLTQ